MAADVQVENGYTRIANEILEHIAKLRLSPTQYSLIFVIWRYTYGFGRKEHNMSLTFLGNATGFDIRNIRRELKRLEERKIIIQTINKTKRVISFNKNYDGWILLPDKTNMGEITLGETALGEIDHGQNHPLNMGEITQGSMGETTHQERNKENSKENILGENFFAGESAPHNSGQDLFEEPVLEAKTNEPSKRSYRTKKNKEERSFPVFDEVWKKYPLKRGKGQIRDSTKDSIEKLGIEIIARCIDRYKKAKPSWQHWQYGSTFFNSGYKDFLDGNYEERDGPENQYNGPFGVTVANPEKIIRRDDY
ncbi:MULTISPECIES: replication protein [unclassified Dehalobacter]|uniref:replication protein n=1 Tax=unclassified Dehalobacter TaxID=2635733 RepID=UPI00028B6D7A|nr:MULTISPECIES: replication protein [unclassified Dehalobacter]AFV02835.1 phage replication protein O, N-terminal domain protein [Dehalobacter sp. DCA]AFV05822.1 phage replication protein O, N-terminal domain protein [Dehalobacter sp. CF]